jgi:hypothetical protein
MVATGGSVASSVSSNVPSNVAPGPDGSHSLNADEVLHIALEGDDPSSNDGSQSEDSGSHSVRERVLAKLQASSGVASSLRQWALELCCSKGALEKALGKLVAEGAVAKVQASRGSSPAAISERRIAIDQPLSTPEAQA